MTPTKAPIHLWIIGVVTLLWNAMGALDYVMTKTQNADYMAQFSEQQLEFFYGLPAWVVACWAIAVWGSVLGSLLLLLRKRAAVMVFLIAFVALCITTFQNLVLSNGLEVMGDAVHLGFSALIFLVAFGLWRYSAAMQARGVLH